MTVHGNISVNQIKPSQSDMRKEKALKDSLEKNYRIEARSILSTMRSGDTSVLLSFNCTSHTLFYFYKQDVSGPSGTSVGTWQQATQAHRKPAANWWYDLKLRFHLCVMRMTKATKSRAHRTSIAVIQFVRIQIRTANATKWIAECSNQSEW